MEEVPGSIPGQAQQLAGNDFLIGFVAESSVLVHVIADKYTRGKMDRTTWEVTSKFPMSLNDNIITTLSW